MRFDSLTRLQPMQQKRATAKTDIPNIVRLTDIHCFRSTETSGY
jgi:hypothetical protein